MRCRFNRAGSKQAFSKVVSIFPPIRAGDCQTRQDVGFGEMLVVVASGFRQAKETGPGEQRMEQRMEQKMVFNKPATLAKSKCQKLTEA